MKKSYKNTIQVFIFFKHFIFGYQKKTLHLFRPNQIVLLKNLKSYRPWMCFKAAQEITGTDMVLDL